MLRDARDYQILFLALFLGLGALTRDWTLRPEVIATAIATCLITQVLCTTLLNAAHFPPVPILGPDTVRASTISLDIPPAALPFNWRSPLITALGLSLLLRVDHLPTMVLAGMVAIASKFLLKIDGKHCFNPANLGIIAALCLTHDAWVSPGQWGEDMWYSLIFLGAGGLVLKRVGRWDTSVAFFGSYALLESARNLWLGWTWDVLAHRLMSGSLLVFALFMVTDPRSIPNARSARLVWAGAIAILTFILRNQFYLSTAVFWALLAMSLVTPLLDRLVQAQPFNWKRPARLPQTLALPSPDQALR